MAEKPGGLEVGEVAGGTARGVEALVVEDDPVRVGGERRVPRLAVAVELGRHEERDDGRVEELAARAPDGRHGAVDAPDVAQEDRVVGDLREPDRDRNLLAGERAREARAVPALEYGQQGAASRLVDAEPAGKPLGGVAVGGRD